MVRKDEWQQFINNDLSKEKNEYEWEKSVIKIRVREKEE